MSCFINRELHELFFNHVLFFLNHELHELYELLLNCELHELFMLCCFR